MTRSLAVASADDGVSLEPGGKASVAFAVWDGAHHDRDGQKSITIWQDLELQP
jgi:DMSO reductase family type II enzyme heme b subunit